MDSVLLQQVMAYGSLTIVLLMVGFGTWVGTEGRQSHRNLAFAGIIISVALWLMAFAFWKLPTLSGQSIFWFRSLYFVGALIPVFYYLFSLAYLFGRRLPRLIWPVALLPNLVIGWFAYFSDALVNENGGNFSLHGPGLTLFALHFVLFVVASLVVMLYATRSKKQVDSKELLPVIAGAVFSFHAVFGVLFSSFMATNVNYPLTVMSLVGGVLIMVPFIIRRKLLVDLRLVGVELIILIALFVFISDMVVSSDTIFDFAFRLAILGMLLFYGVMTTRIFIREVKQQQRNTVMQEQVIDMNRRLTESDRLKTKFVSLVVDQLHSPLTSLRAYTELALKGEFGKITPRLKEVLESNLETVQRVTATSQTFLDVGRIESGDLQMFKAETDLGDLVKRLVGEAGPLATRKGLTLRTAVRSNLPLVTCDSGAIYHALMNLVDNAVKFTEQGEITVRVDLDGQRIRVRVTDTGTGMTDEEVQSVWRVFARGVSAVQLESRGEGLGVFIAKQIVQAHEGEMIIESEGKGRGSTFGFYLPLN